MKMIDYMLLGILFSVVFVVSGAVMGYLPDINEVKRQERELDVYLRVNKKFTPPTKGVKDEPSPRIDPSTETR